MNLKEILDYGNTLERTDEQSRRLENASKRQTEAVNSNDRQSRIPKTKASNKSRQQRFLRSQDQRNNTQANNRKVANMSELWGHISAQRRDAILSG